LKIKLISLCLLLSVPLCHAEKLLIPVGNQVNQQLKTALPTKGMRQAEVITRYGEPVGKTAPNGEPPVSRWNYPQFSVYFEGDTVIHSVVIHRPMQVPVDATATETAD